MAEIFRWYNAKTSIASNVIPAGTTASWGVFTVGAGKYVVFKDISGFYSVKQIGIVPAIWTFRFQIAQRIFFMLGHSGSADEAIALVNRHVIAMSGELVQITFRVSTGVAQLTQSHLVWSFVEREGQP